jgi:hypothetical protein
VESNSFAGVVFNAVEGLGPVVLIGREKERLELLNM